MQIYTPRLEQALQLATKLHQGQYRKGVEKTPYIAHPVAVMLIAAGHTSDEDVLIACLLHDTIEDCEYTFAELEDDFGADVAAIVRGVTIPEAEEGVEAHWGRERDEYIEMLKAGPEGSAIVAAADKIHNFTSILSEWGDDIATFRSIFTVPTPQQRAAKYGEIIEVIKSKTDNSIAAELTDIFEKYQAFLTHNHEA